MDIATLKEMLLQAMAGYAVEGLNGCSYLTSSEDGQVLTVVTVARARDQRLADTGLIVRLVGDKIVIERDMNDKMLVDALVQDGVPRRQIVLAYAGESVDAAA
jgi:hypothetical protein